MRDDKPTPIPQKTSEHVCEDPQTLAMGRMLRRLVIPLVILSIGSLGGVATWIATVSASQAELRAEVRHQASGLSENKSQIRELAVANQRLERAVNSTSQEILVQLGELRAEVRAIADRLDRLEGGPRTRGSHRP